MQLSSDAEVDAVGACIGNRGMRISGIVEELGGEKIDIIPYTDDVPSFIVNALSPAEILAIDINEEEKQARVIVTDDQLSLAIGKAGQNARLAARLTGYKIDIKSETQAIESGELPANWMELAEQMEYDEEYEY